MILANTNISNWQQSGNYTNGRAEEEKRVLGCGNSSHNHSGAATTFRRTNFQSGEHLLPEAININIRAKPERQLGEPDVIKRRHHVPFKLRGARKLLAVNNQREQDEPRIEPGNHESDPLGQQHADSMMQNSHFSHWDTQGFKPYMRYSLLNGTGFVEENIAYEYSGFPSFTSTQSVERVIADLEWQMMNNDSACCSNGHRDNILNQFHNRVSIGIAYSSTYVYFVEDFETYLVTPNTPISQGNSIILEGNSSRTLNPSSVEIYYDSTPASLTPSILNNAYNTPYGPGTFVGGVVPSCNNIFQSCQKFSQGITVSASTWQVGSSAIDIQFSLSNFIRVEGAGVYTIYLVQGSLQLALST